jgi:hypothetical protein
MARQEVKPPQELADEHTLAAQRYAGFFIGHPYRNPQMQRLEPSDIDRSRVWKEPNVVADKCIFCSRLTDEEAERRIAGFQYQIDIEATRAKAVHFQKWLESGSSDVPEPDEAGSMANRRRFCELFQDMPTERRPTGWKTKPLPLVKLPLRLKRKLCVEWNHIYLLWMKENDLQYDFEKHEFYREVLDDEGCDEVLQGDHADETYFYFGLA